MGASYVSVLGPANVIMVNPVRVGAPRPANGSIKLPSTDSVITTDRSRWRSNGVKILLAVIFLLPATKILAHVGEQVEEHAGEAVEAGPAIGSLVVLGIMAAAIIGFLIWVIVKK